MKHIHFITLAVLLASTCAIAQQKNSALFLPRKKTVGITLAFPYLNAMKYHSYLTGKSASTAGFLGMGGALFYRQNNVKFSLNATAMLNSTFFLFPINDEDEDALTNAGFDAMVHYPVHRFFYIVGGINYMEMNYYNDQGSISKKIDKTDASYGITVGIEAKLQRQFNLGVYYRPGLIGIGEKYYRHVISMDARFDLTVWGTPRNKR